MAVEDGLFFFDDSVITIDLYQLLIVQNQKSKNFVLKFFLVFHGSIEFDNIFYGNSHTVSVLLVGNF